jgi:hypothetical protein
MNAPQIILIVWLSLSLGINMAWHGETAERNGFITFARGVLLVGLLYWGGFFA